MHTKKAAYRIGYNGIEELKEHRWLKEFKWEEVRKRTLKAPFIPKKGDNFDFRYCNGPEKIGLETEERYRLIKGSQKIKECFLAFYYFNRYANNNGQDNNNDNKANKEGKDVLKLVMKNPHIQYLKEEESESEKNETKMRIERITNYNFFKETSGSHKNIFFGIGDEQYSFMKKLPSSRSTATLLKGYNKKPLGNIFH